MIATIINPAMAPSIMVILVPSNTELELAVLLIVLFMR
jgi:hypothetical protein